jgi:hypothetical protein
VELKIKIGMKKKDTALHPLFLVSMFGYKEREMV